MVMCSFNQNIGLLTLVLIVLQKMSPVVKVSTKLLRIDQDI